MHAGKAWQPPAPSAQQTTSCPPESGHIGPSNTENTASPPKQQLPVTAFAAADQRGCSAQLVKAAVMAARQLVHI